MTEKETAKSKQKAMRKGIVVINKRGLIATLPSGQTFVISGGTISKIIYDSIKPRSVAIAMLSLDNPSITERE